MSDQWRSSPNPGSDTAVAVGCTCAVLDNNHGKWPPYPPDGWWITGGCPVHDPPAAVAPTPDAPTEAPR